MKTFFIYLVVFAAIFGFYFLCMDFGLWIGAYMDRNQWSPAARNGLILAFLAVAFAGYATYNSRSRY